MKYILELEDEPNKEYFGEGNYYRCKQIPYWSISESMRNRLEPYDEADRKTESDSEKPNNCEHITEDGVTCAKYPACDDCPDNPLNKVKGSERLVKGNDEPTISKMEQVKDEPQTERSACDTCQWYNGGIPCGVEPSVCKQEAKDNPTEQEGER